MRTERLPLDYSPRLDVEKNLTYARSVGYTMEIAEEAEELMTKWGEQYFSPPVLPETYTEVLTSFLAANHVTKYVYYPYAILAARAAETPHTILGETTEAMLRGELTTFQFHGTGSSPHDVGVEAMLNPNCPLDVLYSAVSHSEQAYRYFILSSTTCREDVAVYAALQEEPEWDPSLEQNV